MEPKLTRQTISLLAELLRDPARPRFGRELAEQAGVRVSTVYDTLLRLEESGWLASEWEQVAPAAAGRPRRRLYRFTALGESSARANIHGEIELLQGSVGAPKPGRRGALRPSPAGSAR